MKLLTVAFGFLMISVGSAMKMRTVSHYQDEEAAPAEPEAVDPVPETQPEQAPPSIDDMAEQFQKEIFEKLDDNGDGKIDTAELQASLKEDNFSKKSTKKNMAQSANVDTDDDGAVSKG